MFRHFHAKSLEIAIQNSERLFNFSPHESRIHAHGPTIPRAVGEYEYRLLSSLVIHIRLVPIVIGCLFRVTKKLRVIIDDITLLVPSKECFM